MAIWQTLHAPRRDRGRRRQCRTSGRGWALRQDRVADRGGVPESAQRCPTDGGPGGERPARRRRVEAFGEAVGGSRAGRAGVGESAT